MSKLSERRRDIRAMPEAQTQEELAKLRRHLFDLRLQLKRGEVKDHRQFAKTRADIARLMHHLGELRQAAALEATGVLRSAAVEE
ncbi:MAG: 50S ribosomal protein L29 [Ktedonobacterales bacterium]|nr:50S ribosomal protein L29 [Ktedonobacterales bacterium]